MYKNHIKYFEINLHFTRVLLTQKATPRQRFIQAAAYEIDFLNCLPNKWRLKS